MTTQTQQAHAYILQTKAGQWKYEIWIDGEEQSGGAGYASEFEAIEDALENNQHLENLQIVVRKGEQ